MTTFVAKYSKCQSSSVSAVSARLTVKSTGEIYKNFSTEKYAKCVYTYLTMHHIYN